MANEPTSVTYLKPATNIDEPEVVWLKDKNIKLERRHYKNKNWQARIRIPGAKYKYDRVTTGTPDLEAAKRFAFDRFESQNWRHTNGYSIFAPMFGKITLNAFAKSIKTLPMIIMYLCVGPANALNRYFPDSIRIVANRRRTRPPMEGISLCGHSAAPI